MCCGGAALALRPSLTSPVMQRSDTDPDRHQRNKRHSSRGTWTTHVFFLRPSTRCVVGRGVAAAPHTLVGASPLVVTSLDAVVGYTNPNRRPRSKRHLSRGGTESMVSGRTVPYFAWPTRHQRLTVRTIACGHACIACVGFRSEWCVRDDDGVACFL